VFCWPIRSLLGNILKSLFLAYCLLCAVLALSSCSEDPSGVIIPKISPPPIDACPKWSPDGARIIYYHEGIEDIFDDGTYTINPDSTGLWLVSSDGANNHLLLRAGYADIDWSPDGNWIAFSNYGRIYKARVSADTIDAASIQALTDETDGLCFWPSWSPDGTWIAYDCSPDNHDAIWKIRSDGSEKVKIRDYARDPDLSPQGNRVLYLKWLSGKIGPDIFSMDLTTGDEVRLTNLREYVRDPEYSPDAARVVFSDLNICIVNSDGSNLRRIADGWGYNPSWAPSGQEIVFIRPNYADWRNNGLVYIMNDDGSGLRRLTRGIE
jgi:Tol biopolymer transport system component